ncbi:helix-turn-helix domain-containing protein [Nocardia sp. CA-135398]|uniref:helix-turn-helix domain-containing protein n=1 Tax=Nocardia sp. CA-135398 TaxID=3239977 RepID=UPI003D96ADCC
MAPLSPTVARWELTSRIRTHIAERDLTAAEVAHHLSFTPGYWSKVDKDRKVLAEDKLRLLIKLFGLSDEERDDLLALRAATTRPGWWAKFPNLFSVEHQRLWGLEYGASELSCYESLLIPGLLQTSNYARALIDGDEVFIPKKEVPKRVEARMIRQERLSGDDPLRLNAVISEAALHQEIGGEEVLGEQLRHLSTLIRTHPETLDIRVMPFKSPKGYLIGGAAFYVIEFDRPMLPTLGWHESAAVSGVIEDPDLVRDLSVTFEQAQRNSLDPDETLALIEETAARVG